ncbi:MAG: M48 family metalloprotease [Acidobacteria bacterium]|nr:M48 family metalloprotease [Acidobacteriota bacterium]
MCCRYGRNSHDVFNFIENEAQLAFLLSHEIGHATQEHSLRRTNDRKKRPATGW